MDPPLVVLVGSPGPDRFREGQLCEVDCRQVGTIAEARVELDRTNPDLMVIDAAVASEKPDEITTLTKTTTAPCIGMAADATGGSSTGDTGGNTGRSVGVNARRSAGGNTDASIGRNAGESEGESEGGNADGSTGGNTGTATLPDTLDGFLTPESSFLIEQWAHSHAYDTHSATIQTALTTDLQSDLDLLSNYLSVLIERLGPCGADYAGAAKETATRSARTSGVLASAFAIITEIDATGRGDAPSLEPVAVNDAINRTADKLSRTTAVTVGPVPAVQALATESLADCLALVGYTMARQAGGEDPAITLGSRVDTDNDSRGDEAVTIAITVDDSTLPTKLSAYGTGPTADIAITAMELSLDWYASDIRFESDGSSTRAIIPVPATGD